MKFNFFFFLFTALLIENVRRDEKLKDIANTITNLSHQTKTRWSTLEKTEISLDDKPTRDEADYPVTIQMRPKSLQINCSTAPSIVSAIIKKIPQTEMKTSLKQNYERGDPDGGCNIDELPVNYLSKNSELRVNLPAEDLLNSKKGWLMKQDNRTNDWSKHWFTLRGAALFYYRDPVAEERGVLDGVLDVNSLTSVSEVVVQRNFGFQLTVSIR